MRIIMHVDMDCFFAQVEERENPSLKGLPVIVGADPKNGKGRGVVTTCNYEARAFGIKSAMPISQAWKRCPHGIFLPGRHRLYREASQSIMAILREFSDVFQQVIIDEAYLDLSKASSFEEAESIAKEITGRIAKEEQLTCSVGIGPNKMIAKIAANENKPGGLTIIQPEEVDAFLEPKSVRALLGVGPRTHERLQALGIETIADLRRAGRTILFDELGSYGVRLFQMACGNDNREVYERAESKSIGREKTFQVDTKNKQQLLGVIDESLRRIYRELCVEDVLFRTVTLKIRYENFETKTRSKTFPYPTNNLRWVRAAVIEFLSAFLADPRKVRLVGVSVSNLTERKALKQQAVLAYS